MYVQLKQSHRTDRVQVVVEAVRDFGQTVSQEPTSAPSSNPYVSLLVPEGSGYHVHGLVPIDFAWAVAKPVTKETPWELLAPTERNFVLIEIARGIRRGQFDKGVEGGGREELNRVALGSMGHSLDSLLDSKEVDTWRHSHPHTEGNTGAIYNRFFFEAKKLLSREPPDQPVRGVSPSGFFAHALEGKESGVCRDCSLGLYYLGLELGAPHTGLRYQLGSPSIEEQGHAWVEIVRPRGENLSLDPTAGREPTTKSVLQDGRENQVDYRFHHSDSRIAAERPLLVPKMLVPASYSTVTP